MAGLKHTITLEKNNGKWLILEDLYYDLLKIVESLDEAIAKVLKDSEVQVNDIKEKRIDYIDSLSEAVKYPELTVETYGIQSPKYWLNRGAGVAYARQWALGMNSPPWGNYESPSLGGDCTNFTNNSKFSKNLSVEVNK